ncbi:hypothetical protein ACM40_16375 [Chryseobacterium sp. BLS98]|nr:hypothetical protein ACM40_16375 [Chryseobacterium sp. BLS98]
MKKYKCIDDLKRTSWKKNYFKNTNQYKEVNLIFGSFYAERGGSSLLFYFRTHDLIFLKRN